MPVATPHAPQSSLVDTLKASVSHVEHKDHSEEPFNLRAFAHFDSAPSIGTEFREFSKDGKPVIDIRDLLGDETKLRALGRLVSERGVVFFRNAIITPEEQRVLIDTLGRLGGKPKDSGLHIHPLTATASKLGDDVQVISNEYSHDFDKGGIKTNQGEILKREFGKDLWHSDITFEPYPSDYASLTIRTLPEVGGDTLWASAYEAYDRLSPAYQTFLESLTATHAAKKFIPGAIAQRGDAFGQPRGHPENVSTELEAVHPVIRTHPLTGWKGLFVNKEFTKKINELTQRESDTLLDFLFEHVSSNHDLQVRFRWEKNSLAIWDNRITFHAATKDTDGILRIGTRSVSVGERPYFDPKSVGRREGLAKEAAGEAVA
ncbi:hypothetical protein L202_06418 [Cryptococcus amylolentus CBS 6039]|uniref:TauD/TfdA-like domain-containing protein n=1 Tax=Cryptococcus amylolentus CBS 6039 TaxID=1295533 RepID=A0A1E3HFV7_9TREE|nr:hypothetical protein L202_06418 [Cryptococcus amylolentus CBS 6039]ODN75222.1 hypothetical protein L202_06418 [Cryptococcus amylolentus CBS 6039]